MAVAVDSTAEIDTDLHHNAVNVLLYIYDQEDKVANTSEIGAATGLSSANISGGHAQELERRGLIERAGSVESNAPINTNVYTTTPRGNKEAKRLLNQTDAEIPMPEGEKLALLNLLKENHEDLEQLSKQQQTGQRGTEGADEIYEEVNRLQERIGELEEKVEKNDTTIGKLDSRFERLAKIVKSLRE